MLRARTTATIAPVDSCGTSPSEKGLRRLLASACSRGRRRGLATIARQPDGVLVGRWSRPAAAGSSFPVCAAQPSDAW